jgi:tRNA-guanine family transglycosylase
VRQRVDQPSMIALGGMVPFLRGWMSHAHFTYRRMDGSLGSSKTFIADALAICREQFPKSSVHVFGAGSPTTAIALLGLGADSVDSLAWRRAAGYGTIFLAGCAERIVSTQPRIRASRPTLSESDRLALKSCQCPICSPRSRYRDRIAELARSYVSRAVHNIWTLRTEEIALRAAVDTESLGSFLESRIRGRHRFAEIIRAERAVVALGSQWAARSQTSSNWHQGRLRDQSQFTPLPVSLSFSG